MTTTAPATTALPATGTYAIDPSHSSVEFSVRHLGLSKVKGRFADFGGQVVIADDPTASSVEVAIAAASFDTRNADRDAHVRGADFLDVESFPELTFTASGVRSTGAAWALDGTLTVKGVTRPVTLAVDFDGSGTDPWGNDRAAFSATTEINREDFGLTWNQALETGGVLVGKTVKIEIDVQAVRQ